MGSEIGHYLCFTGRLRSARLSNPSVYSEYQQFLHDTIKGLHDGGMRYRKIAEWLRARGQKTVRGKRFFANHVFLILKRKREKKKRLQSLPEDRFKIGSLTVEQKLSTKFDLPIPNILCLTFRMKILNATICLMTNLFFVKVGVSRSVGYLDGCAILVKADYDFIPLELNSLAE